METRNKHNEKELDNLLSQLKHYYNNILDYYEDEDSEISGIILSKYIYKRGLILYNKRDISELKLCIESLKEFYEKVSNSIEDMSDFLQEADIDYYE